MIISSSQMIPEKTFLFEALLCGTNNNVDWHQPFVEHISESKWYNAQHMTFFYSDSYADAAWKHRCAIRSRLLLFWFHDSHPHAASMYEYGTIVERAKRVNITVIAGFSTKSALFSELQEMLAEEIQHAEQQSQGLTFSDMHLPFQRRCLVTVGWSKFLSLTDSWMAQHGMNIIHWKQERRL